MQVFVNRWPLSARPIPLFARSSLLIEALADKGPAPDERVSGADVKEADVRASGLHGKVSGLQRASKTTTSR
jgi:hypothetical protein